MDAVSRCHAGGYCGSYVGDNWWMPQSKGRKNNVPLNMAARREMLAGAVASWLLPCFIVHPRDGSP